MKSETKTNIMYTQRLLTATPEMHVVVVVQYTYSGNIRINTSENSDFKTKIC